MKLILFRHGPAQPTESGLQDADRRLTPKGIQRTTRAALGLTRLVPRVDLIITSPKRRALETARILGRTFEVKPQILPVLATGSPARIVHALLRHAAQNVLVVGHEPSLGRAASLLLNPKGHSDLFALKKSGALCLEAPADDSEQHRPPRLLWLATPRMLRALRP